MNLHLSYIGDTGLPVAMNAFSRRRRGPAITKSMDEPVALELYPAIKRGASLDGIQSCPRSCRKRVHARRSCALFLNFAGRLIEKLQRTRLAFVWQWNCSPRRIDGAAGTIRPFAEFMLNSK